jgi:hypothetical protein
MSKLIFTGCSFTAGNGWRDSTDPAVSKLECKDHPNLWVNLVATQIEQFADTEVVNFGKGGLSNAEIFANTVDAMTSCQDIDTVFCQWTSMPRYTFDVGFELWPTTEGLLVQARSLEDVKLSNGQTYPRKYLDDILDRFLALHHLHLEIVKVLKYCTVLQNLSQQLDIKLYFVNGLCPWDLNYFMRLHNVLPEAYTPFTKKEILEIDSRDDQDIFALYSNMHNDYDAAGGCHAPRWINLYDSMLSNIVDTNYDHRHPGTKSNQLYLQQVKNFLKTP